MKHLVFLSVVGLLVLTSCSRNAQVTNDGAKSIELVVPYDMVQTGHVGGIPNNVAGKPDPEKQVKFDRIDRHECAAVAYSSFGQPIYQGNNPPKELDLKNVFSDGESSSKQFVVWQNGSVFYCLGFNELGTLVFKSAGHRN